MADWSPDGKTIAFVSAPAANLWIDVGKGQIATMSYSYANNTHTFGAPQIIVGSPVTFTSGTYDNFFFPSWSPDGKLIVFDAARANWRNFTTARSPGQRLALTDGAGSFVVDLAAMNGAADLNVTWPHWAPANSAEYYWVVFSSERDYGHEVTGATSPAGCKQNGVSQCKQIWIGAIAKSKVPQPGTPNPADPSSPPVWMPGQDGDANNISPYWTLPTSSIPR
jgi:Tol biopolymer transport system component